VDIETFPEAGQGTYQADGIDAEARRSLADN
jgi:hypothetical protein